MSVVVIGLNQRSVPLDVLERTTVADDDLAKVLADLRHRPDVSEAVVLSTCMRTEVYVQPERFHGAVDEVGDLLAGMAGVTRNDLGDGLYWWYEDDAVRHLFEVASGIDSAILGESEVLGQVRRAWERATEEKAAGPVLSALFRHAVETGKRARAETRIARGTTSLPHAAVALAKEALGGGLEGRNVVVVGTGEIGRGIAAALAGHPGIGQVTVASRSRARAAEAARDLSARAAGPGELAGALAGADVALTSAGSSSVLVDASDLEAAMRGRTGRPMLVVDVAVPRNVDRSAAGVEGVTLLDMDDLRSFAERGVESRRREVKRVREIIADEVGRYLEVAAAREAAPLVSALRSRAEEMRRNELERSRSRLSGFDAEQRATVERITRSLVNKLLHEPTVRLKEAAGSPRGERLAEALRALFDL